MPSFPRHLAGALRLWTAFTLVLLVANIPVTSAQTTTTPGTLRTYSTIYSIGIEWDIAGDTDHDATAAIEYRVAGLSRWSAGLPLVRIDYNGDNMLAGSLLYLNPGTSYEVRLTLADPDGGADARVVSVATRALPSMPFTGRTFHVVPGGGGGDGSSANPFRGVAAAQAVALPGDIFLLHAGNYGGRVRFDRAGAPGTYLVWKEAGDGEVTMNGVDIAASHIWLEGLTVRNMAYATFSIGAPEDVVVRRCRFFDNHYSIYLQQGGTGWYIADNTIVGDTPYATESFDGEGIELNTSAGHTVAHNSITNVADGISYPLRNVDMFGNDIFDTSDDGIEGDYGYSNVRMWSNRIHNAVHNGISFQPQYGGPWYIIGNQIVGNKEAPLKFRTTDRFVLLHNTFVGWQDMSCCNDHHLFGAIARNNLWVSAQGGEIWWFGSYTRDWRTDLDYDGFDWGLAPSPFTYAGVPYADVPALAAASGLEVRGVRVDRNTCFESFNVPGPPPAPIPPQLMTLLPGCAAIDAGAVLPNVNADTFVGAAPDLGAYEHGRDAPAFGPRTGPTARFTASPSVISPGESAALLWTTTDATMVTVDPPIGPTDSTGAREVTPAETTQYTLTAAGPDGTVTATALVTITAGVTPPAAPGNLAAATLSSTQVSLTWTDAADDETGFDVEQSLDGVSFVRAGMTAADVTTFVASGLAASTTYHFRVRAYNGAGVSAYSNIAAATTDAAPLGAPTQLTAEAVNTSRVDLTWSDNAAAEMGFRIERSTNGKMYAEIALVGANVVGYSDLTVRPNRTYHYRVRAYDATAVSAFSNVASARTPRR